MKKRSLFLILVLFTLAISSCKYNFIVPIEEDIPEDTIPGDQPVSYATQIQPIFNNKCIECHKSGDEKPYLTSDVSYNQVVPAHVNLNTPEESHIYVVPLKSNTTYHKWKKYNDSEASLVLKWIQEGAKNN